MVKIKTRQGGGDIVSSLSRWGGDSQVEGRPWEAGLDLPSLS